MTFSVNETFRRVADYSRFHLKRSALELGLLDGHSDYCKFFILGRGRSGSNFLRGLLNSHSRIVVFGELFRSFDSIGWEFPDYEGYLRSPRLRTMAQHAPVEFLRKKVFRKFPEEVAAVGFKLFYYHAQEDSRQPVWNFLRDQKEIKVIHLKRNNTLKVLLSEKKAFETDRWTNTTGEPEQRLSINIKYEECLQFFSRAHWEKESFDEFFDGNQKLDVVYEDLADNLVYEIKRVQEFLGVGCEPVQPRTYKQSNQPLSEAIANYFELKKEFNGSPWESFFED